METKSWSNFLVVYSLFCILVCIVSRSWRYRHKFNFHFLPKKDIFCLTIFQKYEIWQALFVQQVKFVHGRTSTRSEFSFITIREKLSSLEFLAFQIYISKSLLEMILSRSKWNISLLFWILHSMYSSLEDAILCTPHIPHANPELIPIFKYRHQPTPSSVAPTWTDLLRNFRENRQFFALFPWESPLYHYSNNSFHFYVPLLQWEQKFNKVSQNNTKMTKHAMAFQFPLAVYPLGPGSIFDGILGLEVGVFLFCVYAEITTK